MTWAGPPMFPNVRFLRHLVPEIVYNWAFTTLIDDWILFPVALVPFRVQSGIKE